MTNNEKWNQIVNYFDMIHHDDEKKIQLAWEKKICHEILNYNSEIIPHKEVQMGSTKYTDIVLQKDGKDAVVIELKKHTLHCNNGQAQLFSYMKILSSENNPVHLGLLVCEHLYIYYYDFTKSDEENDKNKLEIRFTKDNPDGEKFVELFSKENFDEEKIRDFIQSRRRIKDEIAEIQNKVRDKDFLRLIVEEYFEKSYDKQTVKDAIESFQFYCKKENEDIVITDIKQSSKTVSGGNLKDKFYKYLQCSRYTLGTTNSYISAINKVCKEENLKEWEELVQKIDQIVKDYDIGGSKQDIGSQGHNTVICGLKRFKEFQATL